MELIKFKEGVFYNISSDSFCIKKNELESSLPISICLKITNYCNLKCKYCLSSSGPGKKNTHNNDIYSLINSLKPLFPLRIVISGGEPLLFPYLLGILSILKAYGNIIVLATNGTISFKHDIDIMKYLDWVDVSLHGVDKMEYKSMRGTNCFRLIVENVEYLSKIKSIPNIAANYLLHKKNVGKLAKTLEFYRRLGIKKVRIDNVDKIGRGSRCDLYPIDSQTEYSKVSQIIRENRQYFTNIIPPANKKKRIIKTGYFVIDHNNNVQVGNKKYNLITERKEVLRNMEFYFLHHMDLFKDNENY